MPVGQFCRSAGVCAIVPAEYQNVALARGYRGCGSRGDRYGDIGDLLPTPRSHSAAARRESVSVRQIVPRYVPACVRQQLASTEQKKRPILDRRHRQNPRRPRPGIKLGPLGIVPGQIQGPEIRHGLTGVRRLLPAGDIDRRLQHPRGGIEARLRQGRQGLSLYLAIYPFQQKHIGIALL